MASDSRTDSLHPLTSLLEMAALRLPEADEYLESRRRLANPPSVVPVTEPLLPSTNTTRQVLINMLANNLIELVGQHNDTGQPDSYGDSMTSNLSHNGTALPDLVYRHTPPVILIYCIAYLIVFAIGLVGNCLVIAVVYRSPRMRTVTNFFIVNLAFADILVIVFCLPATLMSNIYVPWVLGWWMCKTVPYVQGVSVAASVYSLIAVSVDRFLAIWWPMKCQITTRRARIMIFFIWLIAVTTTIPWALFFDLVVIFGDRPDIQLCIEVWPDYLNGSLYFLIANLLFCYILPLILISLCYILIWVKVCKRHIPSDTKDAQMERMQQKSKVKVVKMLVAVVILFVLSWLPLYVIFARIKLGGEITSTEEEILMWFTPIAQWLGASNSCINPILYAFFNTKYRRGFNAILQSRRCCSTLRYYDSVAMANSSSASMRKSSYYVTNNSTRRGPVVRQDSTTSYMSNNSSTRRAPPVHQDSTVSYISNTSTRRGPPVRQDSTVTYISNNSSTRRGPPVHQDSDASYISNNTGV